MSYITTNSKIHFSLKNPSKDDININDIAHALSYLCRANGHLNSFYSVAQHSINCYFEAVATGYSKDVQLACLLHDASEAYLSDLTRPVKKLIPQYQAIEDKIQKLIYETFNVSDDSLYFVKGIDDALLFFEFKYLLEEKVLNEEPELLSHPDFSQRDFQSVKKEFVRIFTQLTTTNTQTFKSVGIDGCKNGWMVAIFDGKSLLIERYDTIDDVLAAHKTADMYLIDIPIGLADSREEAEYRPDRAARKILKRKASSIFPAPFRSVSRARSIAQAWETSRKLNAGTSLMTMGIRGAVNDVDIFLQNNASWKNILCESHPEVCFAVLNGGDPIMEKKSETDGIEKRLTVLQTYGIERTSITEHPLFKKHSDDVIDAACLALVGRFATEGKSTTIPDIEDIMTDASGLKMQMIIPTIS